MGSAAGIIPVRLEFDPRKDQPVMPAHAGNHAFWVSKQGREWRPSGHDDDSGPVPDKASSMQTGIIPVREEIDLPAVVLPSWPGERDTLCQRPRLLERAVSARPASRTLCAGEAAGRLRRSLTPVAPPWRWVMWPGRRNDLSNRTKERRLDQTWIAALCLAGS